MLDLIGIIAIIVFIIFFIVSYSIVLSEVLNLSTIFNRYDRRMGRLSRKMKRIDESLKKMAKLNTTDLTPPTGNDIYCMNKNKDDK